MSDFPKLVDEYLLDIYDMGVDAGLKLAIKLVEACREAGYPLETLTYSIQRLIDNPPPRGSE